MQLYSKNNIIIINATEHKGTIEEKNTHKDTGISRRQGKNPL